ncbi:MAG: site-specific DNA-methyltransferase [Bacteroidia bacterium]|nr:site-specific DNA-methyltransferase [Bacteroidia bacterium]
MNGESLNITQDNLDKLKALFPDIFSEGKIDLEKFKATFTDDINFANERYVLNWAGKSDAFKVLQIPTAATLKPQPDESVNFDTTENVFVEGENLEVLKVLQKSYYNKVKCIIIDPPYNTGSDSFIYPDSFKENKVDYEKRIGDKDEEGYLMKEGMFRKNSKDSGHYHSNWLSMMYPRLFLAKNLLRDDGVIFVHIDDNEVHNLRLLMNEIFGEENFVASIIWQKKYAVSADDPGIAAMHDYIITFRKTDSHKRNLLPRSEKQLSRYKNIDNDPRGDWSSDNYVSNKSKDERPTLWYSIKHPKTGKDIWPDESAVWRYSKENHEKMVSENRLYWGPDYSYEKPRLKRFLSEIQEGIVPNTWWTFEDVGHNDEGQKETGELIGKKIFSTPKPVRLIKRIVEISSLSNCIILDFFAGSGTTAQAVLELNKEDGGNRKFVLVQLPELCDESSEAAKAGYKTIADISKERIRRVIKNIEHRKEHLEKGIENDTGVVSAFEKKLAELKKKTPQLFETEKGNPEIESIKKQIEQIGEKIDRYTEELNRIDSIDKGFKVYKLSPSNFKIWRGSEITSENLVEQLDAFTNPVKAESKTENILFELMLKAGYLLTDKVEAKGKFFSVKDGELLIALEELNPQIIDAIIKAQPQKVITLDNLFAGNDQLKTNMVLQMRDAGIDFKTI